MRKLVVSKKYDGKNLNRFIFDSFPNLNSNQFYKALRKKDIRINGVKTSENNILHEGDEVCIYIVDSILENTPQIPIVYEDQNILIVNKPENISVTENSNDTYCLTDILKKQIFTNTENNFLEPCHRIDRNTKGLVVFAKNNDSLSILLQKFKNKEIEKYYVAKVYGIPKNKSANLKAYLFKDSKKNLVYISNTPQKNYLEILTDYKVINANYKENYSISDINLHTGRTHQIRAHLAHIGFPVIGDGKYGNNNINKKFAKKTQELYSYKIIFKFTTDSGNLDYLKNKEISLPINLQ